MNIKASPDGIKQIKLIDMDVKITVKFEVPPCEAEKNASYSFNHKWSIKPSDQKTTESAKRKLLNATKRYLILHFIFIGFNFSKLSVEDSFEFLLEKGKLVPGIYELEFKSIETNFCGSEPFEIVDSVFIEIVDPSSSFSIFKAVIYGPLFTESFVLNTSKSIEIKGGCHGNTDDVQYYWYCFDDKERHSFEEFVADNYGTCGRCG